MESGTSRAQSSGGLEDSALLLSILQLREVKEGGTPRAQDLGVLAGRWLCTQEPGRRWAGDRKAARVGKWGMGSSKEPATVTRRLSGSPGFALMPLGFENQWLLAREWHPSWHRRSDTLHRPGVACAQLGRWLALSVPKNRPVPTAPLVPRPWHRPALEGAPRGELYWLPGGRALAFCLIPISAQAGAGGPGAGWRGAIWEGAV